jgi:hypothetical protein
MKQTVKTSRAAGQLEKMFRELNKHYFGGALPEPIISLKKTPSAYGHITCAKVWQAGQERSTKSISRQPPLTARLKRPPQRFSMRWCTSTTWRTVSRTPPIMVSTTTSASRSRQNPTGWSSLTMTSTAGRLQTGYHSSSSLSQEREENIRLTQKLRRIYQ